VGGTQVSFQSEIFEVLQSKEDQTAEMNQMRQWVQFLGTANSTLEVELAAASERAGAEAERAELAEHEASTLDTELAAETRAAAAAAVRYNSNIIRTV
jgi:hypothetical protein